MGDFCGENNLLATSGIGIPKQHFVGMPIFFQKFQKMLDK